MTSKEALDFIKNYILKDKGRLNVLVKTAFELVEKDLDRLEKLEKAIEILKRFVTTSYCRNEETKKWDIPVMYSFGLSEKITQEEYDLLKEVL